MKRVIHWIGENHKWLFSGIGGRIVMAIAGVIGAAIVFTVTRCAHDQSTMTLETNLPSPSPRKQEGSTQTPLTKLDAAQEEVAAIQRGLIALDSHGVLRLLDLRKGVNAGDPKTLNYLAWHWATCPKNEHIDAALALKFAQRANVLKPNDDNFTDTLAAAYARNGNFVDAIATEQKAMDLVDEQIAGITAPDEPPPLPPLTDDSEVNQEAYSQERHRKLEKAWEDYRERTEPYVRRRNELDSRLQVYRKGLALISPKDYPTSTPEQP